MYPGVRATTKSVQPSPQLGLSGVDTLRVPGESVPVSPEVARHQIEVSLKQLERMASITDADLANVSRHSEVIDLQEPVRVGSGWLDALNAEPSKEAERLTNEVTGEAATARTIDQLTPEQLYQMITLTAITLCTMRRGVPTNPQAVIRRVQGDPELTTGRRLV